MDRRTRQKVRRTFQFSWKFVNDLQDILDRHEPEGTHFRVTMGYYKDGDEAEPYYHEVSACCLVDAAVELLSLNATAKGEDKSVSLPVIPRFWMEMMEMNGMFEEWKKEQKKEENK